jgi:hypothetical protein
MEVFSDGYLLTRILLTVATIGYGLLTIVADFNKTHATNPLWTPHARFHVVWQITSYIGFGIVALGLIWMPGPQAPARLYLAAGFAAIVYGAFFVAVMAMPVYGGRLYDDNGYPPFTLRIAGMQRQMDANTTAFSLFSAILAVAVLLLLLR